MLLCTHLTIELREERVDGMHCQGWSCLACTHLAVGECHHETWCRSDFCGADPLIDFAAAAQPVAR